MDSMELKCGGCADYRTLQAWINFGHALLNFHCFLAFIGWVVSAHLQTNCWSDWAQIWWVNSLWNSPGLIKFWLYSPEFVISWPLISHAVSTHLHTNGDRIQFKFGGWTHYRTLHALINSLLSSNEYQPFPGLWLFNSFCAFEGLNFFIPYFQVTSSSMVKTLEFISQLGPTFDDLPPFQWSTSQFHATKHFGMPDLVKFEPIQHKWGSRAAFTDKR